MFAMCVWSELALALGSIASAVAAALTVVRYQRTRV